MDMASIFISALFVLPGVVLILGGTGVLFRKKITYGPGLSIGSDREKHWPQHYTKNISWITDKKKIYRTGISYILFGLMLVGIGLLLFFQIQW